MKTNSVSQVTGTQRARETGTVRGSAQEHRNVARPARPGISSKKQSFSIGPFTGPEKVLILYEINSDNGAIKAKLIDPASGRVIREIDVKPESPMIEEKGLFFESMA